MSDRGRLNGKSALITGAAGGIGSAIARAFVEEGARVAVTDMDGSAAAALAQSLNGDESGRAIACSHDVTSEQDWTAALAAADEAFGGISVLVNNAGVWSVGSIDETDYREWRRCLDINLDSIFTGTRLALPYLREAQPASIINLSSVAGLVAGHNIAAYNTSKAGAWMLTKSTALSCARKGWDIRANSIHPTFIETGMLREMFARGGEPKALDDDQRGKLTRQIPLGRLCTVEDVAFAAIYLASDESRYMTGAEIKLDGGLSAM
ncbi:SDR family oxidoreductase [Microbaculum marinum]|uniref:SDR family oxidoreductase n=1 Tax=Microbaculum marinum TaxID=1764581 RepID=A0AAW9S5I0_9HYPH